MLGFKPRETKEGNDPHPGQFAGTEPAAGSGILDVIKGAFDSMKNRPPALGSTGGPEPFRQLVMIDGGAQTFYYTYPDLNKPPQELGENSGMGANAPNSQNSQNDRGASGSGGPGTRNGDGDGDGDGDGSNDGNGDGRPPEVDPDA
jgi:hypothetical protein